MSDGKADLGYPDSVRRRLESVELESPWFRARNRAILHLAQRCGPPQHLVEIGAGNGIVARHLQDAGISVTALEPSEIGVEIMVKRGIADARCTTLEEAALPSSSVEAVGLFDVIEHLRDPHRLLQEVHRILQPGGLCLIAVPALPWMWSQVDEHSGHHRRYRRSSLTRELERAGLSRVSCEYRFAFALLPILLIRVIPYRLGIRNEPAKVEAAMLRQLTAGGKASARVIGWEMHLEERIARRVRLPIGSSIVGCFVKRPERTSTRSQAS
jgi:SAM-dependent methyltransferase